jgi:multidrug efflux pump subunit AcrA (membrane-fusion protein)
MTRNKFIYPAILVVVLIFLFLPIKFPYTITSKGKIFPYQTWTLAKTTSGRLITSLNDNSTGSNHGFSIIQFEQGDAVQFKLSPKVLQNDTISAGDTVGYIISSEIEKDIQKLKGELETARASLNVKTSSEKESVIEAEKNKLSFAEKELEEQTKIFERKKKLFDKDLISQQEFEADEARFELAKINISIAQERLRTVSSGAKSEEINFANTQINVLENEIDVLRKRFESNNILSPITGITERSYSSDTILVVNDIYKTVSIVPVKWDDIKKIKIGQIVTISSAVIDEVIYGKVFAIDNNITSLNNLQYVFVTILSDDRNMDFKNGLIVECNFDCGDQTPLNFLLDFFRPIYK